MKNSASETASEYTLSESAQPVISVEGSEVEGTPATFSNIFALVGVLLLAQIILLLFILLICRCGQAIQRHRQRRMSGGSSGEQP
ncbi:MAG: hypothetical protein GX564_00540 [Oligosphaeraceae bacterium]|nr:hypothetical protein [Oligosphaeraceae bacterium]